MHAQVLAWFAAQVADLRDPITGLLDERLTVVEVGSLDINGSVRPLLRGVGHHHGLDLVAGPGVDEVADASTWVPPRAYDLAVSAEVLEHAPRWRAILTMLWGALAPGGRLLVTCAGTNRPPHSAVDGLALRPGEHYANVGLAEVADLVSTWDVAALELEWAAGRGDLYLRADRRV